MLLATSNLYKDGIDDFRFEYPYYADRAVDYKPNSNQYIIVKLEDGDALLYDIFDKTIRKLPTNPDRMSEEEFKHEFGYRLRKTMFYLGVNQADLAERTGLTQPAISNYMTGKTMPSSYVADKIARALGCSVDEFRYLDS